MRELKRSSGYQYKDTRTASGAKVGRPRGSKNSRKINKRPPGKAPPTPKAKRGSGNLQSESPLTPEVSRQIAKLWLVGTSLGQIAETVGAHKSAVAWHVDRHLLPTFRSALAGEAVRVASLLREASRISWARVLADNTDSDSLKLFCWACDNLLSISGAHSPIKVDVSQQYRIAGQPPAQIEASMLNRLARRIEDLRSNPVSTIDADSFETLEE